MTTLNITNARRELYRLVEEVNLYNEPTLIVGRRGNAVLVSEEDWNAMQETLYLNSVPGMTQSIIEGMNTPPEECLSEDQIQW